MIFATLSPFIASVMAWATFGGGHPIESLQALMATILTSGATPAMPVPLLMVAAIIPAHVGPVALGGVVHGFCHRRRPQEQYN